MQTAVLDADYMFELGRRAAAAAAEGMPTFSVPELESVAATIALDRRVERAPAAAQAWRSDGNSYHTLIRLCDCYVMEIEAIIEMRLSLIDGMLERIDALQDRALAGAADWLLFQVVHEKSFPVDVSVLRRELAHLFTSSYSGPKSPAAFTRRMRLGLRSWPNWTPLVAG